MSSNKIFKIKRGDIYYVEPDLVIGSEQSGVRPVVVVQNNDANDANPTIVVLPITSIVKKTFLPTHIKINKGNILKKDSVILTEQIKTIDKDRIISFLGTVDNKIINKIEKSLMYLLDLEKEN